MKKSVVLCVVMMIAGVGLVGCGTTDGQAELRIVTKIAVNHLQVEYDQALAKCADPNDCPKAERYAAWLATGQRFIGYLENPVPDNDYDRILLGIAIVKAELTAAGETELLAYVRDIELIASELKFKNQKE